jgi:hypothetical protein
VGEGGARSAPGEGSIAPIDLSEDIFEDRIASLQDVVVPISKDAKSFTRQNCISCSVTHAPSMLATVDLYDDPPIETHKIENVVSEWNLAAEFVRSQTAVSQQPPHRRFGIGGRSSHLLGVRQADPAYGTVVCAVRHDPSPGSTFGRATLSHKGRG